MARLTFKLVILIPILFLVWACHNSTSERKFDRLVWLIHNDPYEKSNPRESMTGDLIQNYLGKGVTMDSVFALLGQPFKVEEIRILPEGIAVPDSVNFINSSADSLSLESLDSLLSGMKVKERHLNNKKQKDWDKWFQTNSAVTGFSVLYIIGWSTIDPMLLRVTFNLDSTLNEIKVGQG